MIEVNFFTASSFDASPSAVGADWVRAVFATTGGYTVQSATPDEVNLVGTAASGLAGYRIVLLPAAAAFTPTPGAAEPVTGAVGEILLYDQSGRLVSTVADLPAGISLSGLGSVDQLGAGGGLFSGSEEADTITGFVAGDAIEGHGGDDLLSGGVGGAGDYIAGGPGADTIMAGAGNDLIVAGDGADRLDGGLGTDFVSLEEATGFLQVWLNQAAPAGQIRIDNVELLLLGGFGAQVHGGEGVDLVLGGAAGEDLDGGFGDDILAGLGGDDTIRGGFGDDLLDGGSGGDILDGGAGFDVVDYSAPPGALTIDLRITAAQQTGHGLDVLTGVEGLYASSFGDTLTGDAAGNYFDDQDGANRIDGREGDDEIYSGRGADTVSGGLGNDTLDDLAGANYLRGDEGDDYLYGGSAFDDLNGNMGNDTVDGYLGDDWVVGGKDHDVLRGGLGNDLVYGNLGDDRCDGDDGADIVRGGQGDDTVNGGAGNDYVSGDLGTDVMAGGGGADIFHSFATAGHDTATDFNAAEGDRVQLDAGATYTLRQDGADTVIDMGGGNQMTLVGVTLSSLPAGWIFVG